MAYSYIDIQHDVGHVVLEGLDPSFFVIVPYVLKQDVRVYSFDKAVHPKGQMLSDYQVGINVDTLGLPEGSYRVFRATRFDRMLYNFAAGSRFDARTYQRNWTQLLHLYQEIIEGRLVLDLIGTQGYSTDVPQADCSGVIKQLTDLQEQYEASEREVTLQKGLVAFEKSRAQGFETALQQERQKVADKERALGTAQQTIQRLQHELEEARRNSSGNSSDSGSGWEDLPTNPQNIQPQHIPPVLKEWFLDVLQNATAQPDMLPQLVEQMRQWLNGVVPR